jgi:molybdopterin molybdotransferase
MIAVEQALELVEQHVVALRARRVPLGKAAGLVLAEDVRSDIDSPPYHKAMMDGYAVRSSDREPLRQVLEEVAAGSVPRRAVTPGTASRVMTGAPLPEGADAVVRLEQTEMADGQTVRLHQTDPPPGQHVMPLGTALRAGNVVLRRGTTLRPPQIAILAETGHSLVPAYPQPRAAVLPTGNELVPIGDRPAAGQIRDSNGPMLLAALAQLDVLAVELGIGRDDRADLKRRIEQGFAADVLVVTGGVSAGKYDLVPEALAELGVEQVFHKVSLRPGKPVWFGVKTVDKRRVLVFGLPGNPVSSFVCFELFVRPAIAALAGRGFVGLSSVTAELSHVFQHTGGRAAYLPARVTFPPTGREHAGGDSTVAAGRVPTVEILPWHGSADLVALARANGLVKLAGEPRSLDRGTSLDVLLV